jgi:glycosyltransferase involved in cell wall biosynthesis
MKISVIVPCFNCEVYVAEAIHSILNQTVKVDELIAIDDGSTDNSLEVLKTFGDKIRLFSQENKGVSETLNFGIRQSKGDYVAFLDSDDLWEVDKIERQLIDIQNNPEYSIFAGSVRQFVSPEIKEHNYSFNSAPTNSLTRITILVKKELFYAGGWFKEGSLIEFIEWVDLMRSKNEGIYFSQRVLASRRLRPNSLSQTKNYYPYLLNFLKNRIDSNKKNEQK